MEVKITHYKSYHDNFQRELLHVSNGFEKAGQKPSLLIYAATSRFTGTSNRFNGSYQSNTFTLSISNVQSEDVAVYYCQQYNSFPLHCDQAQERGTEVEPEIEEQPLQIVEEGLHPLTLHVHTGHGLRKQVSKAPETRYFIMIPRKACVSNTTFRLQTEPVVQGAQRGRGKTPPTLTLLPPSLEEVTTKGTATLVCLADHFYPDAVEVEWKKDGSTISAGVQTSDYLRASDNTYSVSSLLTLSGSDWESNASFSCSLTHESLSSPLSKGVRRAECA
uniref:immunoglobulin lambda-1 light chain-like n=1 Tax=Pristiophorus japonicus TaxID=55135 RepID=UPI00398EDD07